MLRRLHVLWRWLLRLLRLLRCQCLLLLRCLLLRDLLHHQRTVACSDEQFNLARQVVVFLVCHYSAHQLAQHGLVAVDDLGEHLHTFRRQRRLQVDDRSHDLGHVLAVSHERGFAGHDLLRVLLLLEHFIRRCEREAEVVQNVANGEPERQFHDALFFVVPHRQDFAKRLVLAAGFGVQAQQP